MQTHYDVLGIEPTADLDTVKHAWHVKVMLLHPDRHEGAAEEIRAEAAKETVLVNAAWETLKDPAKRRTYDLQIAHVSAAPRPGTNGSPANASPSTARTVQVACTKCGYGQAVLATANRFTCAKCSVAFRFCQCAACKKTIHVQEAFERWTCPACKHGQDSYWVTTTSLTCVRCSKKFKFAKGARAVRCGLQRAIRPLHTLRSIHHVQARLRRKTSQVLRLPQVVRDDARWFKKNPLSTLQRCR